MKKVLLFFAVMLTIITAGCEKQNKTDFSSKDICNSFTAKAEITFRDLYMTAQITRSKNGELKVKFITPESLSALETVCLDGECSASFDGIEFSSDSGRFPQAEFTAIAAQAFDYVQTGIDLKKTVSDGKTTYHGSTDSGVFALNRDSQSGSWLDLSVEGAQLHIVFKEFKPE